MKLITCFFHVSGLGATLNVAKPQKGSLVAIFGLGAVGLAVKFHTNFYKFIFSPSLNKLEVKEVGEKKKEKEIKILHFIFFSRLQKVQELQEHQGV